MVTPEIGSYWISPTGVRMRVIRVGDTEVCTLNDCGNSSIWRIERFQPDGASSFLFRPVEPIETAKPLRRCVVITRMDGSPCPYPPADGFGQCPAHSALAMVSTLPPSILVKPAPRTKALAQVWAPGWGRGLDDGQLPEDSPPKWLGLDDCDLADGGPRVSKVGPEAYPARWVRA